MLDALGWLATAIFSTSYFFRQGASLRRVQGAAACLWVVYGLAIGAAPVVVANLIVGIAAFYSSLTPDSSSSAARDDGPRPAD